jgi:hypothetical protein
MLATETPPYRVSRGFGAGQKSSADCSTGRADLEAAEAGSTGNPRGARREAGDSSVSGLSGSLRGCTPGSGVTPLVSRRVPLRSLPLLTVVGHRIRTWNLTC